ncbi:mitochondrial coenzyme A diphosphatase NUDT8 isoform X1 [Linepithema humile]|uniref:mitochondrial coenzyme A diphosphatase NUDT8 isoform X1 n=1 Tax=Linepithema humile TaxID=83485 RepID=UPI0006232CD8|nr:PREDICTED: nucleoside diphosphate-linked moiety X motif 8, mitochondrial isoform X1 [Linepithema humile]
MKLSVMSVRPLLRTFSKASEHRIDMVNSALSPKTVLSENNRKKCIEKFKSYQIPLINKNVPEAAVLVPLCLYKGELGFLYTLRSMKLTNNGGEASFPGGMSDKSDADLQETALRETWEELKIPKEKIDVWTTGTLINKGDVNVMPVLGYIGEIVPEELEINPDEVEEAFVVSLQKLCDPELFRFTRFSNFNLPSYLGGKHRVWGFTGFITHLALSSLIPEVYMNKIPRTKSLQIKDHNVPKEVKSNLDKQSKL